MYNNGYVFQSLRDGRIKIFYTQVQGGGCMEVVNVYYYLYVLRKIHVIVLYVPITVCIH